jgi:RES domain-containing protein
LAEEKGDLPTVRLTDVAYRGHDPQWAWDPVSGNGAASRGGRFNPKGVPALYLSLAPETVFKEQGAGLSRRFDPLTVCACELDVSGIVDLSSPEARAAAGVPMSELDCPWLLDMAEGRRPASWALHERLVRAGAAGLLVPSLAVGARADELNVVLWTWSDALPHSVRVIDAGHRLPKNRRSWEGGA